MTVRIASNACVDPQAQLDFNVEIGPFCTVGPAVRIGSDTRLLGNVTVTGNVTIGRGNTIHPGAVLGGEPQDTSYRGADTRVTVGDDNVIRECVTINRASEKEEGVTTVGSHNFFMACCHIAHDCQLGDHVTIANASLLAGHVHVHDRATISGGAAIHHFVTVGNHCFVAGLSVVRQDVAPYMLMEGNPARARCLNLVGLKRNHFDHETIEALAEAYRLLYRSKVGLDSTREILRGKDMLIPQVNHLLGFIQLQHEGLHGRGREGRKAA